MFSRRSVCERRAWRGEGGGGGIYATALGVIEVTDQQTRFIGLHEKRTLAGAALLGFCLGVMSFRRRR